MLEVRLARLAAGRKGCAATDKWAAINPEFIVDYREAVTPGFTMITINGNHATDVVGERVVVMVAAQFAKQTQRPVLVEGVDADGANPGAATVAAWRALDERIAKALGYAQGAYYPTYPEALAACEAAEAEAKDRDANAGKGDEQETRPKAWPRPA